MRNNIRRVKGKLTDKEIFVFVLFAFVIIYFTFLPFNIFIKADQFTPYIIGVVTCAIAAPAFGRTRMFAMAFLYTLVLLLNARFKTFVNLGNVLSETSSIIFSGFIAYYSLKQDASQRFRKLVVMLFCAITLVYAISTYVFYITFPGIMRWAAMSYNQDAALPYFAMGLAPYSYPHGLACIIPAFVLGLKIKEHSRKFKVLCLVMLIVSLLLIYITQATGAMVVALLALVCSCASKVCSFSNNIQKITIISLFLMPIAISEDIQLGIIHTVKEIVGANSHYISKLEELEQSITTDTNAEGDIQYRGNLLELTLNSIAESPIIGVNSKSFGNHNALPDRWAMYGLIAFIPIMLYIVWMIKFTLTYIPFNYRTFYIIGVAANLLMMTSKSMFAWHQWFAFLVALPLMVCFCGKSKKRKC